MKKINEYLTSHPLNYALILTGIDIILWIIFMVLNLAYQNTIDFEGYHKALELGQKVDISSFYGDSSLTWYFIDFLFLFLALYIGVFMIIRWVKYIKVRIKGTKNE